MGGQSLIANALRLRAAPLVEPDKARRIVRVRAGTRWRDMIAALDPLGFSPVVTQSNHDFSVGGTLSSMRMAGRCRTGRSAHGALFRLMLADGSVVTCSRERECRAVCARDRRLRTVRDRDRCRARHRDNVLLVARPSDAGGAVRVALHGGRARSGVRMAYGRLSVARDDLSRRSRARLIPAGREPAVTAAAAAHGGRLPLSVTPGVSRPDRIGGAKKRRWYLETVIGPRITARKPVTRNAILNHPVAALADTDRRRTDILHEYFVAPERFAEFLAACREIIPASGRIC